MARRTKTASSSRTPSSARWRFRSRGAGAIAVDDEPAIAEVPAAPPVQAAAAATDPGPAVAPAPRARDTGRAPATRAKGTNGSGGTALFLGDAAGAVLLANEARYRTLEAIGIRREDANIATTIGLLMMANAVYERAHRPKPPEPQTAVADLAIGLGALRESIYGVAGPAAADTPLAATLIALAILGGLVRQPAARGMRGLKASSRRLNVAFRGRYGHLVNLGPGD